MMDDMEARRITDIEKCVGKTIAGAHSGFGTIGLRFSDGTFWFVEAAPDCGCADPDAYLNEKVELRAGDYLDVGLIDRAEYGRLLDEEQERKRSKAERAEREQYERLRAKFAGKGEATHAEQ